MPEDNTDKKTTQTPTPPPSDSVSSNTKKEPDNSKTLSDIVNKINDSQNILIALSGDPSVDEMSAAIGLSLFLDKLGKRATAIYSGATPNALEFLKPEETFEPTVDALQDFVIALNKDKADHLRYKLDGDFVKIYITPYKNRISETDLDYSYGDFNVDMVIALDVANGIDLDSALREHGRIMHDAVIVNITTGNPGKLGEIEWSDKNASSVSEMIAKLIYSMNSKVSMDNEEATAFLTGIVAATNRFSNAKTTAESMKISSRLMESGANQQLVSKNITTDTENEIFNTTNDGFTPIEMKENKKDDASDPTNLDIRHDDKEEPKTTPDDDQQTHDADLLDDLKTAEATLAQTGAEATPEETEKPVKIESEHAEISQLDAPTLNSPETNASLPPLETSDDHKYGQMLEDALAGIDTPTQGVTISPPAETESDALTANPAVASAPTVPTNPEINGVPTMNYMPLPGEEVLPPPPAPPIDMSASTVEAQPAIDQSSVITPNPAEPIAPAIPPVEQTPEPLGPQPAMQDQVYAPQASDPGAFKIPGM